MRGQSRFHTFADAAAPAKRTTQYFHLHGSGAIYHEGWKAGFAYRPDSFDLCATYPRSQAVVSDAGKEGWETISRTEAPTGLNDPAKSNAANANDSWRLEGLGPKDCRTSAWAG